jgi:hypothetical protein
MSFIRLTEAILTQLPVYGMGRLFQYHKQQFYEQGHLSMVIYQALHQQPVICLT